MDDKARYEVFKSHQGKCHYCGTRLKWEAFEVRGLSGGWVLEEQDDGTHQALCYKCLEFPHRGKTAHRLTICEESRSTAEALGLAPTEAEPTESGSDN